MKADPYAALTERIRKIKDSRTRQRMYEEMLEAQLQHVSRVEPPKLKPCPFCGGTAKVEPARVYETAGAVVKCTECAGSTLPMIWGLHMLGDFYTVEDCIQAAADRWNRRADNV